MPCLTTSPRGAAPTARRLGPRACRGPSTPARARCPIDPRPGPPRLLLIGLVVALAAGLRAAHAPLRWEEVAALYSAYPSATVEALAAGDCVAALTTWTGLHPPLWSLQQAAFELLLPRPLAWVAWSALLSTAAVALVARRAPLAGLLLAGGALQVHYSAELNSYPLLAFGLAGLWAALARPGAGPTAGVGWAALLCWTHALGALSAAGWALRARRGRWARVGLLALAAAPLVPGALGRLSDPGSFRQPPLKPALIAADLFERFGALGLILSLAGLLLAPGPGRGGPAAALPRAPLVVPALGLVLLLGAGAAAPHQYGPLLLFGPPAALGVAAAARGRPALRAAVLALGLLAAGATARVEGLQLGQLWAARGGDEAQAVRAALAALGPGWACGEGAPDRACGGEALVLLRPAPPNDDDKRRFSAGLWALDPWRPLPRVRPRGPDGAPAPHSDHRLGQPRLHTREDGVQHVVYVHDEARPSIELLGASHPRVALVLLHHRDRPALVEALPARLAARGALQIERRGAALLLWWRPDPP